jgi:hypothetical protein
MFSGPFVQGSFEPQIKNPESGGLSTSSQTTYDDE